MASTLPASKSGLYADPREDWLALAQGRDPRSRRARSSIPIIISGIAAASAI